MSGLLSRSGLSWTSDGSVSCATGFALNPPITLEAFRSAPIRCVPVDIMGEIFGHLKPDEVQPVGCGMIPLLAQVCAAWRAVAYDQAALWSSFACAVPANDAELSLLKLYLQRARTAPLTIILKATKEPRGCADPGDIISNVAAYSHQLYSLRLTGKGWGVGISTDFADGCRVWRSCSCPCVGLQESANSRSRCARTRYFSRTGPYPEPDRLKSPSLKSARCISSAALGPAVSTLL
ncbi:hypothetical protein FB451DRAFT_68237 [Mycena latifolia]|nr:hypothetical protein FB451DRAFT_68237 [Mycena latifolia]